MAQVFLARDTQLGRKVALKLFLGPPSLARPRLLAEARATASLNHPNIVSVYQAGELDGHPYLVLEYLEGQSLRRYLRAGRPSVAATRRIGLAIARAISEAHRHEILHRDLKPDNVFVLRNGRVKVLDFGLATSLVGGDHRARELDDPTLIILPRERRDSRCVGTPRYAAPEQWRGEANTDATDVWALGLILYELLLGHHAYLGIPTEEIQHLVCSDEPLALDEEKLALIPGLGRLVICCLDKSPPRRPSCRMVIEALRAEPRPRS